MVDALGGVTVNVCGPIIDGELRHGGRRRRGSDHQGRHRAEPGPCPATSPGDTDSDLARIRRQQIVLSAILQQVTSAGTLLNPSKLDAFLQAFVSNTFTDNVTIDDLVTLAQSFGTLDPSRVTFFTLPTVPSSSDPDALDVDEDKAPAVFNALLNDQPLPGEPAATETPSTPADIGTGLRQRCGQWPDRRPRHRRPGDRQCQRSVGCRDGGDGQAQRRRFRSHRGRPAGPGPDAERDHCRVRPRKPPRGADRGRRGPRCEPDAEHWAGQPGSAAARPVIRRSRHRGQLRGRRHRHASAQRRRIGNGRWRRSRSPRAN